MPEDVLQYIECPCGYGYGTPPYSCLRCRVVVPRGTANTTVWGSHTLWGSFFRRQRTRIHTDIRKVWTS